MNIVLEKKTFPSNGRGSGLSMSPNETSSSSMGRRDLPKSPKRLLLVDADWEAGNFMADLIRPFDYEIDFALSWTEAEGCMDATRYDLIYLHEEIAREGKYNSSTEMEAQSYWGFLLSEKVEGGLYLLCLNNWSMTEIDGPISPHSIKNALRLAVLKE